MNDGKLKKQEEQNLKKLNLELAEKKRKLIFNLNRLLHDLHKVREHTGNAVRLSLDSDYSQDAYRLKNCIFKDGVEIVGIMICSGEAEMTIKTQDGNFEISSTEENFMKIAEKTEEILLNLWQNYLDKRKKALTDIFK